MDTMPDSQPRSSNPTDPPTLDTRDDTPDEAVSPTKDRRPLAKLVRWRLPLLCILGTLLFWMSFPPLNWGLLAWLAPVPWLLVMSMRSWDSRRPLLWIWFAGGLFWFASLHWLRYPHPATSVGWVMMAAYLGLYLPIWIILCRYMKRRGNVPIVLSAPIVWVGLEWLRAHALTGFAMLMLSHTQADWPWVIQISDVTGAYGVSFVIMLVAATITRVGILVFDPREAWFSLDPLDLDREESSSHSLWQWWPLPVTIVVLAACLSYGSFQLSKEMASPSLEVALIQGNIPQRVKLQEDTSQEVFNEYFALSQQAAFERPDLIVWPETMYRFGWYQLERPNAEAMKTWEPSPITAEEMQERAEEAEASLLRLARVLRTPLLIGLDRHRGWTPKWKRYNTAVLIDPEEGFLASYDKIHGVMIGEYLPFGETFPVLYELGILSSGISVGSVRQPSFPLKRSTIEGTPEGVTRFSVNICFESTVPHLIREQLLYQEAEEGTVDLLINQTNDGWFHGSCELDQHLACAVFRAVEYRKPYVIAANTGLSASINANGIKEWVAPRETSTWSIADVAFDGRGSFYLNYGDWPAFGCFLFSLLAALGGCGESFWHSRKTNAE
ncbi:Hypothetical protein PBC10988_6330 [Planctomycetales bacterium 10988]|nr:Hypothetical protein PBC10988_6330 [Planctomycetales bacterium 10988]